MQRWEGFHLSFLYAQSSIHVLLGVGVQFSEYFVFKLSNFSILHIGNFWHLLPQNSIYFITQYNSILHRLVCPTFWIFIQSFTLYPYWNDIENLVMMIIEIWMILERDLWFVTLRHPRGIVDLLLIASSKEQQTIFCFINLYGGCNVASK